MIYSASFVWANYKFGNSFKYSGTWDASEEKRGDESTGILRTITTYSDDEDGEYDGLSFGGASPYELDGDNLKITYPDGPVTFKKK